MSDTERPAAQPASAEAVLPLVEEQAVLHKHEVTTGRVRVRVHTEQQTEFVTADLAEDQIEVERIPIGRPVDHPPDIRTEGDVTIVPVLEEVLVVERRLMLTEEIRIRRRRDVETVQTPVTLRRQVAAVERESARGGPSSDEEDRT